LVSVFLGGRHGPCPLAVGRRPFYFDGVGEWRRGIEEEGEEEKEGREGE